MNGSWKLAQRPTSLVAAAITVVLLVASTALAADGTRIDAAHEAGRVVATPSFVFYSSLGINVYDYLYGLALGVPFLDDLGNCLGTLDEASRSGWQAALEHYRTDVVERRGGFVVALRFRLGGLEPGEEMEATDEEIGRVVELLQAATPAFEACHWSERDQINRTWIASAVELLETHEAAARERLELLFGDSYQEDPIPVEVASYASFSGANTIVGPAQILVAGSNPRNHGLSALEVVFHEASHSLIGPRSGVVGRALVEAAAAAGIDLPEDLWHAVLFYNTGRVVEELLAASGEGPYTAYVYRLGLFERAWPEFRLPLEEHWQPYVDGDIDLATAARRLLSALALAKSE